MTARTSLSIREAADILGIANQATTNEIRSRYHTLVKEWHPDVSQRDPEESHTTMIRPRKISGQLRYLLSLLLGSYSMLDR
jgi:hypothetical protein